MATTTQQATKKAAKPRQTPTHAPFKDMIAAAIQSLKDKQGSSRQAIRKHVRENNNVTDSAMKANFNKALSRQLTAGVLVHPKSSTGRYKLAAKSSPNAEKKKAAKPKSKTPVKKKPAAKKTKSDGAKKTPSKKGKAKKSTTAGKKVTKKPAKKAVKKTTKKPAAKKTPKKAARKPAKKGAASRKK